MADLLNNLGNREAMLLMYLADELSRSEKAEVDGMLRTDPALRQTLESLRSLHDGTFAALAELDDAIPVVRAESAVRRTVREMKRHQVELSARPAPTPAAPARRGLPAWAYPIAGAAAVFFLFLGLWGVGVIDFTPRSIPASEDMREQVAREESMRIVSDLASTLQPPRDSMEEVEDHLRDLQGLEEEANALML